MKMKYEKPTMNMEAFMANEYVAFCGMIDDGTWLIGRGVINKEDAFNRMYDPNAEGLVIKDRLYKQHTIYMGSFYRQIDTDGDGVWDTEVEDATQYGHKEEVDWINAKNCVREVDTLPWGYHYHFVKTSNHS